MTGSKASGIKIEQGNRSSHATSIAPWSLQTPSVNNTAPGLAEIQKAERRERRADQQRQQEQLDKQMRATAAAAAEANDALIKWQASPAPTPVMSLVDIQAEEAKRLTNELLEQQRRRDHEQQQQQHQVMLSANLTASGSSGLSNIWGSANKAWSATGSPAPIGPGLWDEPTPVQPAATNTKYVPPTAASVLAAGLPVAVASTSKQQSQTQLKPTAASIALPSPRNLRKSQTLPTMQNVISKNVKTATGQTLQQPDKYNKTVSSKAAVKISVSEERKSAVKSTAQQPSGDATSSKVNEYESEFTSWCIKSLENMSAKVDGK